MSEVSASHLVSSPLHTSSSSHWYVAVICCPGQFEPTRGKTISLLTPKASRGDSPNAPSVISDILLDSPAAEGSHTSTFSAESSHTLNLEDTVELDSNQPSSQVSAAVIQYRDHFHILHQY